MKKLLISLVLISCFSPIANSQEVFEILKKKLPKKIDQYELYELPQVYGEAPNTNLIATYNGENESYVNLTFTVCNSSFYERLQNDLNNAPKSYEDDDIKILAIEVNGRPGQITFQKTDKRFEGNLLDQSKMLLVTYTGSWIEDTEKIKDILSEILIVL